jgi:hypothetical protein
MGDVIDTVRDSVPELLFRADRDAAQIQPQQSKIRKGRMAGICATRTAGYSSDGSCGAPLRGTIGLMEFDFCAARHVELDDVGDQDDCLRPSPGLAHREPNGFRPIDEQAAAQAALVLRNPATPAVFADEETRGA